MSQCCNFVVRSVKPSNFVLKTCRFVRVGANLSISSSHFNVLDCFIKQTSFAPRNTCLINDELLGF